MKKAAAALALISFAALMGSSILGERRKCEQLPLFIGDPPKKLWKSPPGLMVVSLNMYEATDVDAILAEFRASEALRTADILLLQEVVQRRNEPQNSIAHKLAAALNFYYVFAPVAPRQEGTERGIAILSRYELRDPLMVPLPTFNLVFRSRCRVALVSTVDTALGSIRVANVHLDNRLNTPEKLEQLAPVLDAAAGHKGGAMIGGDFNTGDFFWVSHVVPLPYAQKQSAAVKEAMARAGFSTPFEASAATYDLFGLRLDWIYAKHLRTLGAGIQPIKFSDHHAIWARLGK